MKPTLEYKEAMVLRNVTKTWLSTAHLKFKIKRLDFYTIKEILISLHSKGLVEHMEKGKMNYWKKGETTDVSGGGS